jgi:hypothetical protein
MFKELTLQNIWESEMPVENGSTFKFKSTLWWPTLVEGLKIILPANVNEEGNFSRPSAEAAAEIIFFLCFWEKTFISGPQPQKAVETNHARGEQALK